MYMLTLKPQDIAVLLRIVAHPGRWTIAGLARDIFLSASEVHAALSRAAAARLYDTQSRKVRIESLEEFMAHGIQYVFPATKGEVTRGMPTSIAAPPLAFNHFDEPDLAPVWPHPMGLKRGYAVEPLYRRAADAAAADHEFYELLTLADALREGSPRVRKIAIDELKIRFQNYQRYKEGEQ